MTIAPQVAYGILFGVGLLALVGFVIMFVRLGRASDRSQWPRPPMPLAWPVSAQGPAETTPAADEPPAEADARRRLTYR